MKEKGTDESLSSPKVRRLGSQLCEGGGDVLGVVTPRGGVAQAFHGDQVVELRVQTVPVQEVEGKEDREEQVEVEEERRLKEMRTWMTMEVKWQDVRQDEQVCKSARYVRVQCIICTVIVRVHVIPLCGAVVGLTFGLIAHVVVVVFVVVILLCTTCQWQWIISFDS